MSIISLPELNLLHQPGDDISKTYEQIHALSSTGIFRSPDDNGLIVTSFAALQTLRKSPHLEALRRDFNKSGTGAIGAQAQLASYTPFFVNDPLHTPLATATHEPFSPKHQDAIARRFATCVKDTLQSMEQKETCDLVEDFARTITRRYWMKEIGAPPSMDDAFNTWSAAFIPMLAFESSQAQVDTANHAAEDMWTYLLELAKTASKDSLLIRMTHCLRHLPESHQNGANVIAAITFDGIDSAASAIANILYVVLRDEKLQASLRHNPKQLDNALREALRLEPPLPGLHRGTTAPVTYEGIDIPQGINIFMAWGCGNRDPRAYDAPNEFRLERKNRTILSFGGGRRFCKGRTLALVQCKVALELLFKHTEWIELIKQPKWSPPGSIRTVCELESKVSCEPN